MKRFCTKSAFAIIFSVFLTMAGWTVLPASAQADNGWSPRATIYDSSSITARNSFLLQLADGRTMYVHDFLGADGSHIAYRFTSDGVNWSPDTVLSSTVTGLDPTAVQLPSGQVMIAYTRYDSPHQRIAMVQTTAPVSPNQPIHESDWTTPAVIVDNYSHSYCGLDYFPGCWVLDVPFASNLALVGSGKVLLTYGWGQEFGWATDQYTHQIIAPYSSVMGMIYDINSGTWSGAGTVYSNSSLYSSKPSVVRSGDNAAVCAFFTGPPNIGGREAWGDRNIESVRITTSDNWSSWSVVNGQNPVTVYAGPGIDTWPSLIRLNTGQLWVAFNTSDAGSPSNQNIELVTSDNDGASWNQSSPTMISAAPESETWPALVQRASGQVIAAWDSDDSMPSYLWQSSLSDITPPQVTAVGPSGFINAGSATITADYNDPAGTLISGGIDTSSVSISLDGTPLGGCTVTAASVSCTASGLADGTHTISGSVADTAGNSTPISGSFIVDTQPPALTNIQPAGNITTVSPVISASISDVTSGIDTAKASVNLDGSPMAGCTITAASISCPASNLAVGIHSFTIVVSDNAGNQGSASANFGVGLGAMAVSQAIPTHMVAGSGADISVSMTNTGSTTWSAAGGYYLEAINPQGNNVWGPSRVDLNPGDSVAPGSQRNFTVHITAPSVPGTYNLQWQMAQADTGLFGIPSLNVGVIVGAPSPNPLMLTAFGIDANQGSWFFDPQGRLGVAYVSSGAAPAFGAAGSLSGNNQMIQMKLTSTTTAGLIGFHFRRSDGAAGYNEHLGVFLNSNSVQLHRMGFSGATQVYSSIGFTRVAGHTYDVKMVQNGWNIKVYVDGTLYIDNYDMQNVTAPGGRVAPRCMLTGCQFDGITVDDTAPVIKGIQPAGIVNGGSPVISASLSDPEGISSAVVSVDGIPLNGCTLTAAAVSCPTTWLTQGTHALSVSAVDTSGLSSLQFAGFTVDTIAPVVSAVQPAGIINGNSPIVSASFSDGGSGINPATATMSLDGVPLGGCTATATDISCPTSGLSEGPHTINGSVADNAGNSSPISGSFMVDTQAPVITNQKPAGSISTGSTTISADLNDATSGINTSSVIVTLDGNAVAGCAAVATNVSCPVSSLAWGSHSYTISAADNAGNTSIVSGLFDVSVMPNDPYNVDNLSWLNALDIPRAWEISQGYDAGGGPGPAIAIVDQGIDINQPDLVNKMLPGYSYVTNSSNVTSSDHGTKIAGIVAAESNNGIGVAGVSWGSKIIPIQVADEDTRQVAAGINAAVDRGARVISISLGVAPSTELRQALDNAHIHGVVVVDAAGNLGGSALTYPASYPYVVSVSGNGGVSNYNSLVDVAAPMSAYTTLQGGGYGYSGEGTSFSAPKVAGVAALMLSVNPSLSAAQVSRILEDTAAYQGTPPPSGRDNVQGYGYVDAYKALLEATSGPQSLGTVSGTVRDQSGVPVAGVWVDIYDNGSNWLNGAVTDAGGNYSVSGLPTGAYYVCFYPRNLNYLENWYNNNGNYQVSVTAGSETRGIDGVLQADGQPFGNWSGRSEIKAPLETGPSSQLLQLNDGRTMMVYGEGTSEPIRYRISNDGTNWGPETELGGQSYCDSYNYPSVTQLPSGKVVITYAQHCLPLSASQWSLAVLTSDDLVNWTTQSPLYFTLNQPSQGFTPSITAIDDHHVLAVYSIGTPGSVSSLHYKVGTFSGTTLSWGTDSAINGVSTYASKASLIKISDTDALCAYYSGPQGGTGHVYIQRLTTADGGATWTLSGGPVSVVQGTGNDIWPSLIKVENGDLWCAFTTDEDGNGGSIKMVRSSDGGATWGGKETINSQPQAQKWPGITQKHDGSVLAVWYSTDLLYPAGNHIQDAVKRDTAPPVVANVRPAGTVYGAAATITADYVDPADPPSGINMASVSVTLDGNPVTGCTVTATNVSCPVNGLSYGHHVIGGSVADNAGNTSPIGGTFDVGDNVAPVVSGVQPAGSITSQGATITASYSDPAPSSGINTAAVSVTLDGSPVGGCAATATAVSCSVSGLGYGAHAIGGSVVDNEGNSSAISGGFSISALTPGMTSLLSSDSNSMEGNASSNSSDPVVITADDNFTAFASTASNLVAGDTNGVSDVFSKNNNTGQIMLVSADATGNPGDNFSDMPSVSADGRFVTFRSHADNLVPGDTNGVNDIFRKDTQTGEVLKVSISGSGAQSNAGSNWNSVSADGRYVAFVSWASNLAVSDTNATDDVFLKDMQTGAISIVSTDAAGVQANNQSDKPAISGDGRYVVFRSLASNLVPGNLGGKWQEYLKDTQSGAVTCLSCAADGSFGDGDSGWPAISADGNWVTFPSYADNLVAGDTNAERDIFLVNTQGVPNITRLSTDSDGNQTTGYCGAPQINGDGRYVTFESWAGNLVPGDTNGTDDIFRKDTRSGQILRYNIDSLGNQAVGGQSDYPGISGDGNYIAFVSQAGNLTTGDNNGNWDVFMASKDARNAATFSMAASDGGHGNVTVSINWQNGTDVNNNAVATVRYRLYPGYPWDSTAGDYTSQTVTHASGQNGIALSGLMPGRYYDFQVEVYDPDGVQGDFIQNSSGVLLRDDRFQFNVVASNPHPGGFDEVQVRDFVGGKLYWASNMTNWQTGYAYEYTSTNNIISQYASPIGKAAWQSEADGAGKVYITGEMPVTTGNPLSGYTTHYRAMVGVITEGDSPSLATYSIPSTDDINELIGSVLDKIGNRLIVGERGPGTPLVDSSWPNGGGLWSIPTATVNNPATYQRIYQDPHFANRYWLHLMIFNGRVYAQMSDGSVISAPLDRVAPGMLDSDWTTEFTSGVDAMIVSRDQTKLYTVTGTNVAGYYSTIYTNDGTGWNSGVESRAFAPWSIFQLTDGRLLNLYWVNGGHIAGVSDPVTGDFEFLGGGNQGSVIPGVGMGGGGANYDFIYNGNDIYYGTINPGKVIKATYTP